MLMLKIDYVVGLIDGEGSFTVYIRDPQEKKKKKRRVVAEPRFYVKLIAKDKAILYQLKKFFRCGNIYLQRDKRKNHQNCYRYEVSNRQDLEKKIIPFFRKHQLLLFSKRKDFKIFCAILEKMKRKEHLTSKGIIKLYRLKQTMH